LVKRGDIWLCALDPTVGREIQKTRPCLVVSPDELNAASSTFAVTPLTSGSRPTRFRVGIRFQDIDGLILPDQIRTLDRRRLRKRLGEVDPVTLATVLDTLREMFSE
jgi:mRNA interferase MazF